MTRDDLFNINAGIVRDLAQGIADFCPKAFVLIISNPVNSTVPIAAEVLKAAGVFDPKRCVPPRPRALDSHARAHRPDSASAPARSVFGVTTLDVVRASTMSAQAIGKPNSAPEYTIPVVGGHSGVTILPLLSQSSPSLPQSLFDDADKLKALVNRIQFGGDEVVQAKAGAGSATLSMAYAGYKFAAQLISAAFEGKKGVVAPSYVYVKDDAEIQKAVGQELAFFSVPVELGVRPLSLWTPSPLPLGRALPDARPAPAPLTAQRRREAAPARPAVALRAGAPPGLPGRAPRLHLQGRPVRPGPQALTRRRRRPTGRRGEEGEDVRSWLAGGGRRQGGGVCVFGSASLPGA